MRTEPTRNTQFKQKPNTFKPATYAPGVVTLEQLERAVYDAVCNGALTFKDIIYAIPAESHIRLRDWHKRVHGVLLKLVRQKLLLETATGWIRK